MATQRSRFFNSVGEDRVYEADDFAAYFRTFLSDGVFEGGTALQVLPTGTGMNVKIGYGMALIRGYAYWLDDTQDGEFTLPIPASDDRPRIDLVVLRLDLRTEYRQIALQVKRGTPSGSPVRPALENNPNVFELPLASIDIPANLTIIGARHIHDLRLTDECGIVQSLMTFDINGISAQAKATFEDLRSLALKFEKDMKAEINNVRDEGYISHKHLTEYKTEIDGKLDAHLKDEHSPHIYADEGNAPIYLGHKYRLVIIDGSLYAEVTE